MIKQTVDIIDDFVALLTPTFEIKTATDNGDGTYTLTSNCTWWLSEKDTITIDLKSYTIVSFEINTSITISGASIPTVSSFVLTVPNYVHGTLKMSQTEVDAVNDKKELVPFVYLYEIIQDRKNTDDESVIDREVDLRIFFLNTSKTEWLTDTHYTNVIDPMQSMVNLFIRELKSSKYFTDEMSYDNIPLINFSEQGNQELSIFDCNLSGIELRLGAQIREDLSCELYKCNC